MRNTGAPSVDGTPFREQARKIPHIDTGDGKPLESAETANRCPPLPVPTETASNDGADPPPV